MRLKFKNIGKLYDKTEIVLEGITVLAGENGSGKSTIGKVLYCTFDTFNDYEEKIAKERENSIYRSVRIMASAQIVSKLSIQGIRNRIRKLIEEYSINGDDKLIRRFCEEIASTEQIVSVDDLYNRIHNALAASVDDVLKAILQRHLQQEFDGQICHINHDNEESEVELEIRGEKIKYAIRDDGDVNILKKIRLIKNIIYIDNPYILDELSSGISIREADHNGNLVRKLRGIGREDFSAVDDVIANNRLKKIFEKLDMVGIGNISSNSERGYVYKDKALKKDLSIMNLSTGMKSFSIIKTLLQEGYLEDNGIVILDEPETYLHPEWMKIYAEIIVLLHDALGINFLISTHSVDFLSFIELFSKKYHIEKKTKYYLLESNEDNQSSIAKEQETGIDNIYAKLSGPFLKASEELDSINET